MIYLCSIKGPGHSLRGGGGRLQNRREGGHVKFYPYEKGGGGDAMLMGGYTKFWARYYAVAWSFSHTEWGAQNKFPLFKKGGGTKSFTLSWGRAQKVLDPRFSHFVAPPSLPVINDQSLNSTSRHLLCSISSLAQGLNVGSLRTTCTCHFIINVRTVPGTVTYPVGWNAQPGVALKAIITVQSWSECDKGGSYLKTWENLHFIIILYYILRS